MWQNGGRSGLDQWNFVIDPSTGSQDPTGTYVRRWVPELAKLPAQYLHKPWTAPPSVLLAAGVELGKNYPHRIVEDLEKARLDTHAAVIEARRANMEYNDEGGYDLVDLPWGGRTRVFTKRELRLRRDGALMHPGALERPDEGNRPKPKAPLGGSGLSSSEQRGGKSLNTVASLGPRQSNLEMYFSAAAPGRGRRGGARRKGAGDTSHEQDGGEDDGPAIYG
mmetsp:Transcript_24308/g.38492  ORF Transcript_24308/g.38492 Transcript_24308/m.38492 type:complete len:222 (-) Transcript_24308:35-700(-)